MSRKWTDEEIALLGTDTDAAIAERLGIDRLQVKGKRTYLKIKPYSDYRRWDKQELDLLGTDSDEAVAQMIGRAAAQVRRKRVNCGISLPRQARRRRGPARKDLPAEVVEKLGKVSDLMLARQAGVSSATIHARRQEQGIPPFRGIETADWLELKELPQPDFFSALSAEWSSAFGKRLTYSELSRMTYWSESRLQKWFTAGSAQQPLSMSVRHHLFITVRFHTQGAT